MTAISNHKSGAGNKREQILLAAVEQFLENDFYKVTITEIAKQAEVGKGTVYEYFSSKEDLFKESFSFCADAYLQSFSKHFVDGSSVKKTMEDIITTHLELIKENRSKLNLLFNERPLNLQELQSWVIKRRQELLDGITVLIKKGIELDEIRSDIDVEMAGRLFLALNCIVVGGMVVLDDLDIEEKHLAGLLDLFWNGIGNLETLSQSKISQ